MMLTQKRLKELLSYSPIVGVFEWRIARRRVRAGFLAGAVTESGYITIGIDRRVYSAHTLAWLYMTGELPDGHIDHIDGDRSNNAWSNLRIATRSQNAANSRTAISNTSGVKGVYWCKSTNKWSCNLRRRGVVVFRASFDTLEQAAAAVMAERERIDGQFANHGKHKYETEEETA
jgi:hypothetical protein